MTARIRAQAAWTVVARHRRDSVTGMRRRKASARRTTPSLGGLPGECSRPRLLVLLDHDGGLEQRARVLGSPWRVSLPARAPQHPSRNCCSDDRGASMADVVGHLVAAVGIGVPSAGGRPRHRPGGRCATSCQPGSSDGRRGPRSAPPSRDGFAVGANTPPAARANRRHRRQRALDRLRALAWGEPWRE
jgi:hypothetical protein